MNSKDFKGFPIQVIIDQVYKHKSVALPNYQREFVWKKKQLAALIDCGDLHARYYIISLSSARRAAFPSPGPLHPEGPCP